MRNKKLKIVEKEDYVCITYWWFSAFEAPLYFCAAAFLGFYPFCYLYAFSEEHLESHLYLLGILAIILSLYCFYKCVQMLFNRTELENDHGNIKITHFPFPSIRRRPVYCRIEEVKNWKVYISSASYQDFETGFISETYEFTVTYRDKYALICRESNHNFLKGNLHEMGHKIFPE